MDGQVLQVQVGLLVLEQRDLAPLLEGCLGMRSVEQVIPVLLVDLEVAALDQVLRSLGLLRVLLDGSEYVSEAVWDDAATFRR